MSMAETAPAPEAGAFATSYRTHVSFELGAEHVGQEVALSGAVDRILGPMSFVLRDGYGTVVVRMSEDAGGKLAIQVQERRNWGEAAGASKGDPLSTDIPLESIVRVEAKLVAATDEDQAAAPRAVAAEASEVELLSLAKSPLLFDPNAEGLSRYDRIRFRYLYLKRRSIREVFQRRTDLMSAFRKTLREKDFQEVTTPILAQRHVPGDDRSFLAIRNRQEVFSLPGRRPMHGPVVMASGFDRAYQVIRRFERREAYGPFHQPEHTVLDCRLAFVDEGDLLPLEEELFEDACRALSGEVLEGGIRTLDHEEAWARYGSGHPDLRFDLPVETVTGVPEAAALGEVRAVRIEGGAGRLGELQDLDALAGDLPDGASLGWLAIEAEGAVRVAVGALEPGVGAAIAKSVGAAPGDLLAVSWASQPILAARAAGIARLHAGRSLGLACGKHAAVRVRGLPYFRFDGQNWSVEGDPLWRPADGALEGDPHRARGRAWDLVLDGVEVGSGSVYNHDLGAQRDLFDMLGLDSAAVDQRYNDLLQALRFGVPPHGRVTLGIDRLVALLMGLSGIDEAMPLPKQPDGTDPLVRSPWPIDAGVVRGLLGL